MSAPHRARLTLECRCGGALTLSVAQARAPVERMCPRCRALLDYTAEDERAALRVAAAEAREWRGKNRGLK